MIDYLAELPCSALVFDYDHNAPSAEYLRHTHFAAYERFRRAQPNTPVVFISKPDSPKAEDTAKRAEIVKASYEKAKAAGDENVYHIDGRSFFGADWANCTVDGCHPTDLGFYKMAQKIGDLLEKIIKK